MMTGLTKELNDKINGGEMLRNALEGDRREEERMKEQERKMIEINRRMRSQYQQSKLSGEVSNLLVNHYVGLKLKRILNPG